jgi:hypothetical protein
LLSVLFTLIASHQDSNYYMWYLRGMQIVCHLPMLSTPLPANVNSFYKTLVAFVQFDFLDPEWTTELIFDFDYEKHEEFQKYTVD